MAVDALELKPRTTLALFDAAIRLCSRTLGVWALTLPAGAALVAATFHLVDSVIRHRDVFVPAVLFTSAWLFRAISQGAASHYLELQLLEPGEPSAWRSFIAALKRAPALIFVAGYCLFLNTLLWCLSLGIGFFLVTSHLAAYAVAMKGRGSLLGIYATCAKMLGPARHTASTLRVCGLTQIVVALNLHLLANAGLIIGSKLLAFDTTFVSRFASVDNPVWLSAVLALTFALFEPIRAASAALLLIDGRVRQEGLDLLTQLEQLPRRRKPRAPAAAALLALLFFPTMSRAEGADDWSGTWAPGQPAKTEQSTAVSQRLRDVVDECGLGQRFTQKELDGVDALPPTAHSPLSRFVTRIERLAYDDEDCETAGDELERGMKQIDAIAAEDATSAGARDQATAVLGRPEFAIDPPPPPKEEAKPDDEPDGPFKKWLKEKWKAFIEWLFEPDREQRSTSSSNFDLGFATGLSNLVVVLAIILVVGVLVALLIRSRSSSDTREAATHESGLKEQALAPDPMNALSRPPEGWAGLADELAAKGLFREAIRNLYLALLSRLHRDGAIDYDPSKSNWDYFRGFKGPLAALNPFKELTRRFDFAWYGNLEVSSGAWSTFRTITQPLLDGAAREAPRA